MDNTTRVYSEHTDTSLQGIRPRVRASLSKDRTNYWPDNMYFVYGLACLDCVLSHSLQAGRDYLEIVTSWNQPEHEDLLERTKTMIEAIDNDSESWRDFLNLLLPNLLVLGGVYSTDEASKKMTSRLGEFIETHFNRGNARTPKITLFRGRSQYLGRVIIFRSLSDSKHIDPAIYEKWATDDIEAVMAILKNKRPSTVAGRDLRETTEKTLRGVNFKLHHNDTVQRWAEIWYLARIKIANVNETLNDLAAGKYPELVWGDSFTDDRYLRRNIQPYDIATGRIFRLS